MQTDGLACWGLPICSINVLRIFPRFIIEGDEHGSTCSWTPAKPCPGCFPTRCPQRFDSAGEFEQPAIDSGLAHADGKITDSLTDVSMHVSGNTRSGDVQSHLSSSVWASITARYVCGVVQGIAKRAPLCRDGRPLRCLSFR